ncbi:MAG: hypothetical protein PHT78_13085 [Desulfitobacteriaceae bacterium]|nr:hypothetical protein [Desulfitobacteriaceae bacterium]
MVMMILIPIAVVAIVLLIIAGSKVDSLRGDEDMLKSVYVYLVLFATLMMTIGGSIATFMAAADIISPAPYYQSFAEYRQYGGEIKPNPEDNEETKLSEEELLARYNDMVSAEKERQIIRAKNSLIKSLGWIIIPLPIFLFFQRRLARKENV